MKADSKATAKKKLGVSICKETPGRDKKVIFEKQTNKQKKEVST